MQGYLSPALPALALTLSLFAALGVGAQAFPDPPRGAASSTGGSETAILAGGCFWGIEGVFERIRGVTDATSGYSGGNADTAHYEMVGSGTTGHAETVRVRFDPSVIDYGTILKVFFSVAHDPTQLNYQGPDHGTQYRSVIFYTSEEQRRIALDYMKKLDAAKVFPKPIVTQVLPYRAFFEAEDYHQNFLDNHPDYPYIVYWDLPKVEALNKLYPQLVARR